MKKIKLSKKLSFLSLSLSFAIITPIVVTACSSSIDSGLTDKLVSKGNGLSFTANSSLNDVAKTALKSDSGLTKYSQQIIGQSLLNWYKSLTSNDSQSINKVNYKLEYDKKIEEINDSYDSTYDTSSTTNKSNFPLVFQQEELDKHGGTEDSWKKEKTIDWAITKFKEELFSDIYLSLVDQNGNYVKTTKEKLSQALSSTNDTSGVSFAFSKNYNTNPKDDYVIEQYAKFQKFVFDQWVLLENPFIANQVSWGYGSMDSGNNIYLDSATNNTASASFTGTYNFPYFDSKATNDGESTVSKFTRFVNNGTNGYKEDGTNGLRKIDKGYTTGTDTLKLVTNYSEYKDSDLQSGLALTYLFSKAYTNSGVTLADNTNLSKTVNTTGKDGFDAITSNFVSYNSSDFNGTSSSTPSAPYASGSASSIPYVELNGDLVSKILKNPKSTTGTGSGGSGGKTKTFSSLYTIDAFQPANNGLSDFIFVRTPSGVSAYAIDGLEYIKKANSLEEAKKKAGNIVLYRYLENKANSSNGVSIDLKGKLTTFLNNHFETLVYKYWEKNKESSFISFDWLSENQKNVLSALTDYLYIKSNYKNIENYQIAIYTNKSSLSTNYGQYNAHKNGLASQLPYAFTEASSTQSVNGSGLPTYGYYSVLSTLLTPTNPFGLNSSGDNKDASFWNDPFKTNGAYSVYSQAVDKLINDDNLSALTSDFSGFKYSQYIYSNNYYINQALLNYGNDGNILGDSYKISAITKSINSKASSGQKIVQDLTGLVNQTNLKVSNFMMNNTDVSSDYNSALSNFFFNSVFDSSSNKWLMLDKTSTATTAAASGTVSTIKYTDLDNYRLSSWLSNKVQMSSSNLADYMNFLTVVATSQYLLENNGEQLMSNLRTKIDTDASTFLVWESSVDKQLDASADIKSSKDLLYGTDGSSVKTNLNNSQSTAYYPNKTTANSTNDKYNTTGSTFSSSSNYYTHVSNMNGFQGFITESGSANISSPLKNILFTNPKTYNKDDFGLLYGIASSREELKNKINNFTFTTEVDDLTKKIQKLYPNITEFNEVLNLNDLGGKKAKLIEGIEKQNSTQAPSDKNTNSNYVISDNVFKPRNGYISNGQTQTNASTPSTGVSTLYKDLNNHVSQVEYGSYVIQVNESNLKDFSTFVNYLSEAFKEKNPENGNGTGNKHTECANNLLTNLLVSLSTDSTIQTQALNAIASKNKVDVYDIRLNNQLGEKWANNFKEQD